MTRTRDRTFAIFWRRIERLDNHYVCSLCNQDGHGKNRCPTHPELKMPLISGGRLLVEQILGEKYWEHYYEVGNGSHDGRTVRQPLIRVEKKE